MIIIITISLNIRLIGSLTIILPVIISGIGTSHRVSDIISHTIRIRIDTNMRVRLMRILRVMISLILRIRHMRIILIRNAIAHTLLSLL